MTYRQLLSNIINGVVDLDSEAEVIILFRDPNKGNCCINKKKVRVSHTSMNGRICIEQHDIVKAIDQIN